MSWKLTFFVALALTWGERTFVQGRSGNTKGDKVGKLWDDLLKVYDKRIRPNLGGPAVTVGVTSYVLSINKLSEQDMTFSINLYFRQFWQDPRLAYERDPDLPEKLIAGEEVAAKLWSPDTFFVNERSSSVKPDNVFLRILPSGHVLKSEKISMTASCPMDLQYFPMDRQLCYIEMESYAYTMSDIRYKWNDGLNSVQLSADVSLPQFKVLGHRQKTIEASLSTGNYSRLAVEIQFVRSHGYYLVQVYIPAILCVIVSWTAFWLDREATTARVAIGLATVLTMTFFSASVNVSLPKISYIKSIDVYLGVCFFFVFAALLEFMTVHYLNRKKRDEENESDKLENNHTNSKKKILAPLLKVKTSSVDCISRIAFPVLFLVFQIIYWSYYKAVSSNAVEDLVYLNQ